MDKNHSKSLIESKLWFLNLHKGPTKNQSRWNDAEKWKMLNASLFTVKSRIAYSKIENQWLVDSGCKRMWHVCDESASAEKVLKRLFLTYFCSCFCCCHVLSSLLLNHSKLVLDTNGPLKKKGVRKREIDRTGLPTKHYQKKSLISAHLQILKK